jgi:hypothetical protein
VDLNEEEDMTTRLTVERRRELLRLSCNYGAEGVTPRMRNAARRELHADDLVVLARLDERAADVRRDAVTVLDSLLDPEATWETHFQHMAAGIQWVANYVLELHALLHDVPEEPYLEPEEDTAAGETVSPEPELMPQGT